MPGWITAEFRRLGNTIRWSWAGWRAAWQSEKSLRQWSAAQIISVAFALWLPLDPAERALIIALGFVVLAAELLNTAVETVVNEISTEPREAARKAKDCASAGVALAAIAAAAAWLVLLWGMFGPE
ncbi:MAG: diacylglycerol kinase [Rhodobacteraceae bacterium]|nr:diacylglycerol kinase [Paracoccaceae bacterium]